MKRDLLQKCILAIVLICSYSCKPEIEYSVVGSIYGVITDYDTNSPIQGASVLLTPTNTSITTGSDGLYNFKDIEAGQYKVTVAKSGYIYNSSQVDIVAGESISRDINIQKEVEIVGFSISPTALSFGTNYDTLTFTITNDSSLSSNSWSASIGDANWLTLTPISGTIEVGSTTTVRVDVDRSQLSEDSTGVIILEANGGSKQILATISYVSSDEGSSDNQDEDILDDDDTDTNNPDDDNQPSEDSDGYIGIYTSEELAKIGVDSNYPMSGKYKLVNDITLSDYWTPIGTSSEAFTGTFDGDSHTISGVKIDAITDNQGFFGYVTNGTIKDVILKSPSVKSKANNVGALIGFSKAYTIEGCSVIGGSVSGGECVGGLIGTVSTQSSSKATISSCDSSCSVSGSESVGGVIGSSEVVGASISITSSYNTGEVSGQSNTGGLVGSLYTDDSATLNISLCYNIGAVAVDDNNYVGGLVGLASADGYDKITISSCYNAANVSGGSYIGGIIGCANPAYLATITTAFCYNTGTITGRSSHIGGVIGYAAGYSSSSYVIVASCYNTGSICGYSYVGEMIGTPLDRTKIYCCYFVDQSGDDATSGFGTSKYASDSTQEGSFSELNSYAVISYMNNSSYKSYGSYTAGSPADTYHPSLMGEKIIYTGDK